MIVIFTSVYCYTEWHYRDILLGPIYLRFRVDSDQWFYNKLHKQCNSFVWQYFLERKNVSIFNVDLVCERKLYLLCMYFSK